MRQQFSVVMERLCYELHGISCLELEGVVPAKQPISTTTGALTVFIQTNPFKQNEHQHHQSITIPLAIPTDTTLAF